MPALFTFLFKVNIALLLFCMVYYLVLRHLTFYTLNRIYLVAAILFSSLYPWINMSGFIQRHHQFTAPVQNVILQWRAPAENFVKPLNQPNYWLWAEWIFWAGAILFALRLVVQLLSLYKLYRDSEPGHVHNYPVRLIDGDVSPFSFWRSIYVNPSKLSPADLEKVLEHEQVHVSEWHTLDILLAELSTVFYWFNPGIWLIKKAVKENIEFITDRKILQKGIDSKQYQYSLLNVSMAGSANKLVNNFNISTIKKRIVMMNAKRSSRISLGRYVFVAPTVVILLLVFSISKAEVAKRAIHSITVSLKNITTNSGEKNQSTPLASATTRHPKKVTVSKAVGDTIYARKSKDGKRTMMVTSDLGVDSTTFVLNGAKSTRDEVNALDPALVMSMDLMSAELAKKYVDFTLEKPQVLFVTTSDSETGKKLKARFDKNMYGGVLAKGKNMSVTRADIAPTAQASGTSYSYAETAVSNTSSDVAPSADAAVTAYTITSADAAPEVSVTGKPKKLTTVKIAGSPKPVTVMALNSADVVAPDARTEVVTIDSTGKRHVNYLYKGKNVVYLTKARTNGDKTTIDNFNNDVLYIVDGKEVKNLKKVSGDDIRSISVLRDEAARKLYGDKGKNGVILITTKKASE